VLCQLYRHTFVYVLAVWGSSQRKHFRRSCVKFSELRCGKRASFYRTRYIGHSNGFPLHGATCSLSRLSDSANCFLELIGADADMSVKWRDKRRAIESSDGACTRRVGGFTSECSLVVMMASAPATAASLAQHCTSVSCPPIARYPGNGAGRQLAEMLSARQVPAH